MHYILTFYSLFFFSIALQGQTSTNGYEQLLNRNRVILEDSNRNKSVFYVKEYTKKAKDDDTYYWYTARTLQKSQGAYSGKVLHGTFEEFYPDKKLAQKGQFKKGLKKGEWKYWSPAGVPTKTSSWKRSKESGRYTLYDAKGKQTEQGRYIDGQRDGKVLRYDANNGTPAYLYYNKGESISREDYIQQNIFRRSGNYLAEKWKTLFNKKTKETKN